jgi:hypothetical protein
MIVTSDYANLVAGESNFALNEVWASLDGG